MVEPSGRGLHPLPLCRSFVGRFIAKLNNKKIVNETTCQSSGLFAIVRLPLKDGEKKEEKGVRGGAEMRADNCKSGVELVSTVVKISVDSDK